MDSSAMRLMLLRHAKSEKATPGHRDRDRNLNARGRNDAAEIAAYMAAEKLMPDRIIVSSAQRTRETWQHMAAALPGAPAPVYEDRLYESGPSLILEVIREAGRSAALLVIGHNPGLHETAHLLLAPDGRGAQALDEGLPTSGLVVIDFAGKDWRKLTVGSGKLDRLVTPRLIRTAKPA
jgi:phosphohistidine phosphatase